jgi:hypothetical protein
MDMKQESKRNIYIPDCNVRIDDGEVSIHNIPTEEFNKLKGQGKYDTCNESEWVKIDGITYFKVW